jgi:hypothetical protein
MTELESMIAAGEFTATPALGKATPTTEARRHGEILGFFPGTSVVTSGDAASGTRSNRFEFLRASVVDVDFVLECSA